MYSLVISRTHGRYHNWQLIALELGHDELNNKQCCQRWKCIKHRYLVATATTPVNTNKKRPISGNENTIDNEEDNSSSADVHQFPSPLHSVEVHQPVTAEEESAMIGQQQQHYRRYDVNVEKAFLNQKRKKEPHEIRTKWTPEMVSDRRIDLN